jgi:ATP-dependent helicase/nuclease subunit A
MTIGKWTHQESAILVPAGFTVAVMAGAGTGKTSVLSETVARKIIESGRTNIKNLLVLTFTKKAAAEMADRIEKRIIELANVSSNQVEKSRLLQAAGDIADASIETIDAYASSLIREHASQAEIDSSFEILDQNETNRMGYEVALQCLEKWMVKPPHPMWPTLIHETYFQDWPGLFARLDSQVMTRGEISRGMLLFGRDGADVDIESESEAAIKKSREKYDEIREQLRSDVKNLEGCLEEAKDKKKKDGTPDTNVCSKAEIILSSVKDLQKWLAKKEPDWNDPVIQAVGSWAFWGGRCAAGSPEAESRTIGTEVRSHLASNDNDETLKAVYVDSILWPLRDVMAAALVEFHNAFVQARRDANALSFADCEIEALTLLKSNQSVQDELRKRFEYVVVDEYQDINPLQQSLIYALSRPAPDASSPPSNLYVVGDVRQSIYGFRDADCRIIDNLKNTTGAECRLLTWNFRSRPQILDFINHAFRSIWQGTDIHTDLHPASEQYKNSVGKEPESRIEMHLTLAEDSASGRRKEAVSIANRLYDLITNIKPNVYEKGAGFRPMQWGDCAILLRASAPLLLYEEALGALGIPLRTESGGGFWSRPEIADIRSLLYCISPVASDLDWAVLLRSPWVGLSDDSLFAIANGSKEVGWAASWRNAELSTDSDWPRREHFASWFDSLKKFVGRIPVAELLEKALQTSGYSSRIFAQNDGQVIRANIEKLIGMLRAQGGFDVRASADRLEWLTTSGATEGQASLSSGDVEGAVTLATVHTAKGLEWPLVVLPDLCRKSNSGGRRGSEVPIWDEDFGLTFKWMDPATGARENPGSYIRANNKQKQFGEEEEKRLLYVALTRAREWLILSSSIKERRAKDAMGEWNVTSGSWLSYLNDAFTGDQSMKSLTGHLSDPSEDVLCFKVAKPSETNEHEGDKSFNATGWNQLNVKRYIYLETAQRIVRKEKPADPKEISRKLKQAFDALPVLAEPSARRYIITATEVATFHQCPRMFAYRSIWAVPPMQRILVRETEISQAVDEDGVSDDSELIKSETLEMPSSEWGTLAHKLMELVPYDASPEKIRETAKDVLEKFGNVDVVSIDGAAMLGRLVELGKGALELPMIHDLAMLDEKVIKREFRLLTRFSDIDEVLVGTLDVVALTPGRPIVIDYKSGHVDKDKIEERAKEYEIQLALYSILVSGWLKCNPTDIEPYLIFLNPAIPVPVKIDDAVISRAMDAVARLSERCSKRDFTAEPSPEKCRWCDYHDICRDAAR